MLVIGFVKLVMYFCWLGSRRVDNTSCVFSLVVSLYYSGPYVALHNIFKERMWLCTVFSVHDLCTYQIK